MGSEPGSAAPALIEPDSEPEHPVSVTSRALRKRPGPTAAGRTRRNFSEDRCSNDKPATQSPPEQGLHGFEAHGLHGFDAHGLHGFDAHGLHGLAPTAIEASKPSWIFST